MILLLLVACGIPPAGTVPGSTTCNDKNESCTRSTCDGEGSKMLPGADCLSCHRSGGPEDATPFSAAGTAFADYDGNSALDGAIIRITDANGTEELLTTNSAGNFYTEQALVLPINAEIEVGGVKLGMATPVHTGSCNSCHACTGAVGLKLTGP